MPQVKQLPVWVAMDTTLSPETRRRGARKKERKMSIFIR